MEDCALTPIEANKNKSPMRAFFMRQNYVLIQGRIMNIELL